MTCQFRVSENDVSEDEEESELSINCREVSVTRGATLRDN